MYDNLKQGITDEIKTLLSEKNYLLLKKQINELDFVEISELLNQLNANDAMIMFRLLSKDQAAVIFTELEPEKQMKIVEMSTDLEVNRILNEMFIDDMVDFIEEMPANAVKKILRNTSKEDRDIINQILNYPEKSAGSIMTTEYMVLKGAMTVTEALEAINKEGEDKVTVYTSYVVDKEKKLLGFASLRTILTSPLDAKISDIMDSDVVYVKTFDNQEEVSETFKKYGYTVIPVVDEETRLVGIITVDDIIDVIQEEDTEDFKGMAGISPGEEKYLSTSIYNHSKARITWLFILMITSTVTSSIIKSYNDVILTMTALRAFIPIIMGTGGNSGNQSSTLVIRGMSTGEIELTDWKKVFAKEFQVSLLVGLLLAIINFIRIMIMESVGIKVALVVSITMMMTVISSMLVGGLLPILAKKLKVDPAIMAAPLITTVVDACGLIIYFNIANLILNM